MTATDRKPESGEVYFEFTMIGHTLAAAEKR